VRFIADFHIHSHYSMATSKDCCPEQLSQWARLKGLQVIGTGDFTHPGWIKELKGKLQPAEEGLYRLKPEYARPFAQNMPLAAAAAAVSPGPAVDDRQQIRFLLSAEISSIYKKNGRVRKIHNLLLVPDIASAEKINAVLERIGNIHSDGRPILGLDSRKLLEIALDCCPQVAFIPAHIWTPHFSLLGSRSGFNSLEECFEDLSEHIFALETGLSSDPAMNWRLSALDRYSLVSNSDAHSPKNLAREANCFETELSYPAIMQALKAKDPQKFLGTIEFYPEEGKYHYDGHRNCQVCWSPEETRLAAGICPRCGKKVTIGVMYRATELADRPPGGRPDLAPPYESIVPLLKILAEFHQVGESSKKVQQAYFQLLANLGSELEILRTIPLEEIQSQSNALLAEGVRRVRAGEMEISPGFDGEYGKVKLFDDGDRQKFKAQTSLFGLKDLPGKGGAFIHPHPAARPARSSPATGSFSNAANCLKGEGNRSDSPLNCNAINLEVPTDKAPHLPQGLNQLDPLSQLNEEQRLCVTSSAGPIIIIAGPGTGKTRTLVCRIAHLLQSQKIPPEKILAITFTNKAAQELKSRIRETLPPEIAADGLLTGTFHHLCLSILQEELTCTENRDANNDDNNDANNDASNKNAANNKAQKTLIDEQDALLLIKEVLAEQTSPGGHRIRPQRFYQWISKVKSRAWALDFPSEESPCESPCESPSGQPSSGQSLSGQPSPPPWFKESLAMADFAYGPASGEAYPCGDHTDGEHTDGESSGSEHQDYFWSLCLAYQNLLHRYHAYDYDDLLLEVVKLLQSDPMTLQKYRDRFSHILVDEFQDVNEIQYLLVKLLSADGVGLLVIGDPDQSIYAFRGADYRFFSRLREDFPGHQLFHLKENYRSQSCILQAASAVIKHNPDRFPLELHPHRPKTREPRGIQLHFVASEQAEGISVVREITRLMGGIDMLQAHGQGQGQGKACRRQAGKQTGQQAGQQARQQARQQAGQHGQQTIGQTSDEGTLHEGTIHFEEEDRGELGFSDFAVLFRTSQQAGPLEECFLREGIPYRVVGQKGFLQDLCVQTVLAMLRFLVNPEDDFSLWNLLHRWESASFPESLVRQRLQEIARQNQCSLFRAIGLDIDAFSPGAREGLQRILSLQETYHSRIRESSTDQLISDLIQSDLIRQEIKAKRDENLDNEDLDNGTLDNETLNDKNPDLERLYQCSKQFPSVSEFLQKLLLFRDGDLEYRGSKTSASGDAVSLMTIHAAKGLEFPVIFICGLEEGLLPYDHHDRYSHGHIHLKNEAHEKPEDLKKPDPSQTPETHHKPNNIDQPTLQEKLHREEERRLFYVALTRAKDELVLISAHHRRRYNQLMLTRPSSFLAEIPPDLIVRSKKTPPAKSRQLRLW